MERRGFLKGLFGGVTAAGLVVAAAPDEIAAFASPLMKDAPVVLDVPSAKPAYLAAGEHLYNAAGELVAVVTQINCRVDPIEVTMAGDSNRVYVPGRRQIDIQAAVIGAVDWAPTDKFPRLRGVKDR